MAIWGIDCLNPACVHESVRGYRLRILVRRSKLCWSCQSEGRHVTQDDWRKMGKPGHQYRTNWLMCPKDAHQWQHKLQPERNDMILRAHQRDFGLNQMAALGVKDPDLGNYAVQRHPSLPVGYDLRLLMFSQEALPRIAIYFRWRPDSGEVLTPEKIFQMAFQPGMTAAERKQAPMITLTPEQCDRIIQRNDGGLIEKTVPIRCQHCHEFLPARTLSTLTLREVELGD